jgi:hypothetical protein
MKNLFIFGIGGTGTRVVKSLIMLLSSGVKINAQRVIPILIDPHETSDEYRKVSMMLEQYETMQKHSKSIGSSFFSTEILPLGKLHSDTIADTENIDNSFGLSFSKYAKNTFEEFIGYNKDMSKTDQSFVSMFFSEKDRHSEMAVGFRGNPSMGSIILNKLEDSDEFKFFKRVFNTGDKIFMVSSIFGGTGASGFPLLLKNLQTAGDNIQKAVKGAVSVMPYFKLNDNGESYIDSNSFITKTKAALSFYEGQLKGVDELYYIADSQLAMHNNDETKQDNASHLVEMMAAMGIIDFASSSKRYDVGVSSTNRDGNFHECAINADRNELSLYDLDEQTKELIHKPLIKNLFVSYIYNNLGSSSSGQPWFIEALGDQHEQAFKKGSGEFEPLVKFLKDYNNWVRELGIKERKFLPFDVSQDINEWVVNHSSVNKKSIAARLFNTPLSNDKINVILNEQIKKVEKDQKGFERVLELLDRATDVIYKSYFKV